MRKLLSLVGMRFKPYHPHPKMAWLGWIETKKGKCLGFIHKDGRIVFNW